MTFVVVNNACVVIQPPVTENQIIVVRKINDDTRKGFFVPLNADGDTNDAESRDGRTVR